MQNKKMTYTIATLRAWKIFSILTTTFVMMVVFNSNVFSFILPILVVFGWLYSLVIELARVSELNLLKYKLVSAAGAVSPILLVVVAILMFYVDGEFNAIYMAPFGFIILGSMLFLMKKIGDLLSNLENSEKKKISASILIWFWPIGIWSLQPRLMKVLNINA